MNITHLDAVFLCSVQHIRHYMVVLSVPQAQRTESVSEKMLVPRSCMLMVHWIVELRGWISSRPQAVGQSVARRWGWLHRSGWALLGKTSREDKARPENIFFF